eukprot:7978434-Karenia_brevis.AAC.1
MLKPLGTRVASGNKAPTGRPLVEHHSLPVIAQLLLVIITMLVHPMGLPLARSIGIRKWLSVQTQA